MICVGKLNLMCPNHIGPCASIQDDSIPDDLVSAILAEDSFCVLFTPTLQESEPEGSNQEVSNANCFTRIGTYWSEFSSNEGNNGGNGPRGLCRTQNSIEGRQKSL